jgi:hypothetical protein
MNLDQIVADLNGGPDNAAARAKLGVLQRAGVFVPCAIDTQDSHPGRLGMLDMDGRKLMVQREVGTWHSVKIWQIKITLVN